MDAQALLSHEFEQNRGYLRGVAYRMLGSLSEADDAVQEAWLRLSRADASTIENLRAWLTTVVANVSLDMLRSRQSRREDPLDQSGPVAEPPQHRPADPEQEALLAESVGLALLVVLDTLAPAERLAFVLHDMFAVPFEQIAAILGRTPEATRQLASRARRRVQRRADDSDGNLSRQKEVIEAFLAALRRGDFEALVALLDPDVVVRADRAAGFSEEEREVRGAEAWAKRAIAFARGARFAQTALVNGEVGVVVAPRGRLFRALCFAFKNGKVSEIDVVADPERLKQLDLVILED